MISKHKRLNMYCKDDISKIENYYNAVSDTEQIWDCHHRLEFTLDGEPAHTKDELIRMGMYYNRTYFELIFLPESEHMRLHSANNKLSDDAKIKISHKNKGKTRTDEQKHTISEATKIGMQNSEKYKQWRRKKILEKIAKLYDELNSIV